MVIAADYPFLEVLWTMILFFAWLAWIWILVVILSDVFRRRDIGGWSKAVWIVFLIVLPFLGVLVYLIAQHDGMAERGLEQAQTMQKQFDDRVKAVAASEGPAAEIEKAEALLQRGTISQDEFDALKAKALAAH
jgi:Phospholipase_D-nuclease N-terminal